jgi:hypothetical protein
MTAANVSKAVQAARAADPEFIRLSDQKRRAANNLKLCAAVLLSEMGEKKANQFLGKMATLAEHEVFFSGEDGFESVRAEIAVSVDVGYAVGPAVGAGFALRGVDASGNRQAIVLDFDAGVAVARALFSHLGMLVDENLSGGSSLRGEWEDLMEDVAKNHAAFSGVTAQVHRDARYQAELTIKAHAQAAEAIATEKAEKRVEALVRKLSQAAAMPNGLEKSVMIEEAQPLITRAFGGGQ